MIGLIILNLVINVAVTLGIMSMIGNIMTSIPYGAHEFVYSVLFGNRRTSVVVGFVLNLLISNLIMRFMGVGLYAGMANLGASVIVAAGTKWFMSRYSPEKREDHHRVMASRERKRRKRREKSNRKGLLGLFSKNKSKVA